MKSEANASEILESIEELFLVVSFNNKTSTNLYIMYL